MPRRCATLWRTQSILAKSLQRYAALPMLGGEYEIGAPCQYVEKFIDARFLSYNMTLDKRYYKMADQIDAVQFLSGAEGASATDRVLS